MTIIHIEALPYKKFINSIKNIDKFIASEKIDGNNFLFGFDFNGRFYTTTKAKQKIRYYDHTDYNSIASNNGNKSAHIALEKIQKSLKSVVKNGESCEVELLYGRQPNAIVYGSNYIAFLRMIVGDNNVKPDQSKIRKLGKMLNEQYVEVNVPIVMTYNGVDVEIFAVKQDWKFASVSYIDTHHFKEVNVRKEIIQFEEWLKMQHITGYSYGELMEIKLPSVSKDKRDDIKRARQEVLNIAHDIFMLPIKEKFLNKVIRNVRPALRDTEIEPNENIGIEGVVFLDPETQEQFKIVDKEVFSIINQFNYAIRNQLKSSTKGRSIISNVSLNIEGDIYNNMLFGIANSIGIPQLGHVSGIKRTINKYKGETLEKTLNNFINDFKTKDSNELKTHVKLAIDFGITQIHQALSNYNDNRKNYKLMLKTGKEICYTVEIHKRTLMVFAEIRKELQETSQRIEISKSISDIIMALYGNKLKEIHCKLVRSSN